MQIQDSNNFNFTSRPARLAAVKAHIKSMGWSQVAAAKHLGVTFETLNRVLNGHRESRRLLSAIAALPANHAKRTPAA